MILDEELMFRTGQITILFALLLVLSCAVEHKATADWVPITESA